MIHVIYGTKIYVLETQVGDVDILCEARVGYLKSQREKTDS